MWKCFWLWRYHRKFKVPLPGGGSTVVSGTIALSCYFASLPPYSWFSGASFGQGFSYDAAFAVTLAFILFITSLIWFVGLVLWRLGVLSSQSEQIKEPQKGSGLIDGKLGTENGTGPMIDADTIHRQRPPSLGLSLNKPQYTSPKLTKRRLVFYVISPHVDTPKYVPFDLDAMAISQCVALASGTPRIRLIEFQKARAVLHTARHPCSPQPGVYLSGLPSIGLPLVVRIWK